MVTIKGFTTKKKDWQKDLIIAVAEQGGKIKMPISGTEIKVTKDPFEGVDKSIIEPLIYEKI